MLAAMLAMTPTWRPIRSDSRASLDAVPRGQTEAALALGLRPRPVFVKIVLPQYSNAIGADQQIVIMMLGRPWCRRSRCASSPTNRHAAGAHLPRLRDLFRGDDGLSRPVDKLRRCWCRWTCALGPGCHDRIHLLGHSAQPSAAARWTVCCCRWRLRRRWRGRHGRAVLPDRQNKWARRVASGHRAVQERRS